jgi:hypothetical protein
MRIRRSLAICSLFAVFLPSLAGAQEKHKAGITMGFPAAFGVLWHVSDKVALRPELTFSGSSADTSVTPVSGTTINLNSSGWGIGTGVSALFYLRTEDRLRTYFSPRFTYAHTSSSSDSSGVDLSQSVDAVGGAGSFGAQYAVGDRFTIFGEFGFGLAHSTSSRSVTGTSGSSNNWGSRGGVGIVFYP